MIAISLFIAFYVTKEKFTVQAAGLVLIAFLFWHLEPYSEIKISIR